MSKTEHEIATKIIKSDLQFKAQKWENISKQAIDFCKKLIVKSPTMRMTSKQARLAALVASSRSWLEQGVVVQVAP